MARWNLIPEARADKNGKIVVRWVRSVFGGDRKTSIPKPSLMSRYTEASERMDIRDRLSKKYPDTGYAPRPDGTMGHYSQVAERRVIDRAFEDRDLKKLQLLDVYMGKYEGGIISGVLNHLRDIEGDETSVLIDDRLLSVYSSFHDALPRESEFNQYTFDETSKVSKYVLTHPEDVDLVNKVVARGIIRYEEVLDAVESLKNTDVSTAINDGFL